MPFKKGETPKGANVFQKGVSGNPNGRKKGSRNIKTVIRDVLNTEIESIDQITGEKRTISVMELMNIRLAKNVIDGEANAVPSYNALMDRLEGRATQAVEVGVTDKTPKGFMVDGVPLTPYKPEASEDYEDEYDEDETTG